MCRSTRVDHIVEEEDVYSNEEDHPTDLFIGAISSKMQKSTPVPDEVFVNMNLDRGNKKKYEIQIRYRGTGERHSLEISTGDKKLSQTSISGQPSVRVQWQTS